METAPATSALPTPKGIPLEEPIVRGDQQITHVILRKPKAGELRGLQLDSLIQGDVNATLGLLPRITVPVLTGPEVEGLSIADLAALAGEIRGFFMTAEQQALMAKVLGLNDQATSTG